MDQKIGLENNITGSLKPFALVTPRGQACAKKFRENVLATIRKAEERGIMVREMVMPSLDLYVSLCKQIGILSKKVTAIAKANPICRRLMTVPGVGPIVSLSFVTAVDNPKRFKNVSDVGAYFGLTPATGTVRRKRCHGEYVPTRRYYDTYSSGSGGDRTFEQHKKMVLAQSMGHEDRKKARFLFCWKTTASQGRRSFGEKCLAV